MHSLLLYLHETSVLAPYHILLLESLDQKTVDRGVRGGKARFLACNAS